MNDDRLEEDLRVLHEERSRLADVDLVHDEIMATPIERVPRRRTHATAALAAGLALLAISVGVVTFDVAAPDGIAGSITRTVAADGSGEFASIGAAVAAANDGDTIVVRPGTYTESVTVDKDLTIMGDPDGTRSIVRIPADGVPRVREEAPFAFRVKDADADIGHFTIQGPSEVTSIIIDGGDVTIHDIVDDVDARVVRKGTSFFAWIDGDTTGTIRDNVTSASLLIAGDAKPDVLDNRIGGVVRVEDSAAPRIVGNELGSISVHHQATPTIEDNLVDLAFNTNAQPAECGLAVGAQTPGPTVLRNVFRNGTVGICARGGTYTGNQVIDSHTGLLIAGSDATFVDNIITGGQNGIAISDGSPRLEGNSVEGAEVGLLLTAFATPTMIDNTFCGNTTDVLAPVGAEPPDLSGNTVCNGAASP